jgi:ribA/ribD-fused uncharacterized protein
MSCSKPCSPVASKRQCIVRELLRFKDLSIESPNPNCVKIMMGRRVLYFGFFKKENPFSNHCPTKKTIKLVIEIKGVVHELKSKFTETLFMLIKARYFGASVELIKQIEDSEDPQRVRELGRSIPNFDEEDWGKVCRGFMLECTRAKFNCNPDLLEMLLETGDADIAETSKYDGIYGIKYSAEEVAKIIREAIEKGVEFDGTVEGYLKTVLAEYGRNTLGWCIMCVREEARAAQAA